VSLEIQELGPARWADLERLFGTNGACGGCWCMWWRVPRGGALWRETAGEPAHRALGDLVAAGRAHGVLAYEDGEPVAWCGFGPRRDFPRTERVRAYARDDVDHGLWSINCFFIPPRHRGRGLTRMLAAAAVEACRRRGARVVEAYPVTTTADGRPVSPSFAWTGPLKIFTELGFEIIQANPPTKPLVRLRL